MILTLLTHRTQTIRLEYVRYAWVRPSLRTLHEGLLSLDSHSSLLGNTVCMQIIWACRLNRPYNGLPSVITRAKPPADTTSWRVWGCLTVTASPLRAVFRHGTNQKHQKVAESVFWVVASCLEKSRIQDNKVQIANIIIISNSDVWLHAKVSAMKLEMSYGPNFDVQLKKKKKWADNLNFERRRARFIGCRKNSIECVVTDGGLRVFSGMFPDVCRHFWTRGNKERHVVSKQQDGCQVTDTEVLRAERVCLVFLWGGGISTHLCVLN